jgi:TnsA endonuclease N terminal
VSRDSAESAEVSLRGGDGTVRVLPLSLLRLVDLAGCAPWRVFRQRKGQAHLSGVYWSATMVGEVVYESRLELARLLLADFDPQVVAIYAQPLLLTAKIAGRPRRHVPDFLLGMRDGTVLVVNVKPTDRLADPKVAAALKWPGELFMMHGWRYELWSGADPVVLDNVRLLAAFRRPIVQDESLVTRAWQLVRDGDQLTAAELRVAGGDRRRIADVRPALLALLWSGRLRTDLTRPLSGAGVLWKGGADG